MRRPIFCTSISSESSPSGIIIDQKDNVAALIDSPVAMTTTKTLDEQRMARDQFEKTEMAASRKSPTAESPDIDLKKETKDARERAGFPNAYGPGAEKIIITGRNMGSFDTLEILRRRQCRRKGDAGEELGVRGGISGTTRLRRPQDRDTRCSFRQDHRWDDVRCRAFRRKEEKEESGEKERDKEEEEQQ